MSSSSTHSRKTSTTTPSNTSKTDIFANLGLKSAYSISFDAIGQYSDAQPFLETIRNSFTASSVLREKEVRDYESRTGGNLALPSSLLFQASAATETAPSANGLKKRHDEVLTSARKRLEMLKAQRTVLRELLEEKESSRSRSFHHASRPQNLEVKEAFSRFRSKIAILRRLAARDISSVSLDTGLFSYHDAEEKYVERIADYASDDARRCAEINQESPSLIPPRLMPVLHSYGKICAQQVNCEIQLARFTAFLTSLSINDGSYLEMTNLSMNTLLRDIRSRTATCIKRKLEDVTEDAIKDLSGEVHAYLLSENLQRQDAYIETMQACIRAYMLQRLRIHCFQVLVDIVCRKRDLLFDSISSIRSCWTSPETLIRAESQTKHVSETIASSHIGSTRLHLDKLTESTIVDEVESSVFAASLGDASHIVQNLKQNVGARKHCLDVEIPEQLRITANRFEDALASTSSVLEALFRHYETLVDGRTPQLDRFVCCREHEHVRSLSLEE